MSRESRAGKDFSSEKQIKSAPEVGSRVKQSSTVEMQFPKKEMAPRAGLEPATIRLTVERSTS